MNPALSSLLLIMQTEFVASTGSLRLQEVTLLPHCYCPVENWNPSLISLLSAVESYLGSHQSKAVPEDTPDLAFSRQVRP